MSNENLPRVCNLVAETLNLAPAAVQADTTQASTPKWDSLGHLNVILSLEQEFGVSITPEQAETMTSIAAIVAVLDAHG